MVVLPSVGTASAEKAPFPPPPGLETLFATNWTSPDRARPASTDGTSPPAFVRSESSDFSPLPAGHLPEPIRRRWPRTRPCPP